MWKAADGSTIAKLAGESALVSSLVLTNHTKGTVPCTTMSGTLRSQQQEPQEHVFRVAELLKRYGQILSLCAHQDSNGYFGRVRIVLQVEHRCSTENITRLIAEKTLGAATNIEVTYV
ncbi:MAG: hypothetical protein QG621_114 [Patescibacteria group bacterium]|nr:hypothetical protein [Patescibacteria group bacterium]